MLYTKETHLEAAKVNSASHLPIETSDNRPTLARLYALSAEYARISNILDTLRIEQERLHDITRNHKTTKAAINARAKATEQARMVNHEISNWSLLRLRLFNGFDVELYVFENFIRWNTPVPYAWMVKFADCPIISAAASDVQFWAQFKVNSDKRTFGQKPAYWLKLNMIQREHWYTHQARLAGRDMLPDTYALGIASEYAFRVERWGDLWNCRMTDGYGIGFQARGISPKQAYTRVLSFARRYRAYNYNRRDKLGRLIL